jgi:hypothetical protein
MSSNYYYKGTSISSMITSGTSTVNGYEITYNPATSNYDRLDNDCGIIKSFQYNGGSIANNIQANGTTLTSTGNVTIPSWADSFKLYITTNPGTKGAKGVVGETGDIGQGGNSQGGSSQYPGQTQQTGQGGAGGAGGDGGDGGDGGNFGSGIIAYTEKIYTFNSGNINCQFNTGQGINIGVSDTIRNFTINATEGQNGYTGQNGYKGEKGGTGQNGQGSSAKHKSNSGATGAKGAKGATGATGATGTSGSPGSVSVPNSPFALSYSNSTNNSVVVYFFKA